MFDKLMTDLVTIHAADGQIHTEVPASVQRNRIFTRRTDIPVRPGDKITRRTPAPTDLEITGRVILQHDEPIAH